MAAFWRCVPDPGEPREDDRPDLLVDRLQHARLRDLAEVLGDHRRGTGDEVAPARDELGVVALHELAPGEVGVGVLRARSADEVPEAVGAVAVQDVANQDRVAP